MKATLHSVMKKYNKWLETGLEEDWKKHFKEWQRFRLKLR
jgi:hypothetical protein